MPRQPEDLPKKVDELMEQTGLNEIKILGEKIGVPRPTLSLYLRGKNDMPLWVALALAKAFKLKESEEKIALFESIAKHRKNKKYLF